MVDGLRHFLVYLIGAISLLSGLPVHASDPVLSSPNDTQLTLAITNSNLKPLKWREGDNYVGPMVDLVKEISVRSGIQFNFIAQPFARTLKMIEQGSLDGAFGNYRTPEREQFAYYFEPALAFVDVGVFSHVDVANPPQSELSELYGHSVVKIIGHSASAAFVKAVADKKIDVVGVSSYESMLELIRLRRVNFAVGPTLAMRKILEEKGYTEEVVATPLVLKHQPLYLYLSKRKMDKNMALIMAKIRNAMLQMCQEQRFEALTQSYGCPGFEN